MTENQKMVKTFHEVFNHPIAENPRMIDAKLAQRRVEFIISELQEYIKAIERKDLVEATDALADAQYFLDGTIIIHGLQNNFIDFQRIVHESNMSKICKTQFDLFDTIKEYEKQGIEIYHETHNHPEIGTYYVVKRKTDDKVLKSASWYKPEENIKERLIEILENVKQ